MDGSDLIQEDDNDGFIPLPQLSIPYHHIASTHSINSSTIFVYYQLNDTAFGESQWDDASGFWIFRNMRIALR